MSYVIMLAEEHWYGCCVRCLHWRDASDLGACLVLSAHRMNYANMYPRNNQIELSALSRTELLEKKPGWCRALNVSDQNGSGCGAPRWRDSRQHLRRELHIHTRFVLDMYCFSVSSSAECSLVVPGVTSETDSGADMTTSEQHGKVR